MKNNKNFNNLWICLVFLNLGANLQAWIFKGIELIGTKVDKAKFVPFIPLTIGKPCDSNDFSQEHLKEWALTLKKIYAFQEILCDFVLYDQGDAYLVINIIERPCFRAQPYHTIQWQNSQLIELHDSLYQQFFTSFKQGIAIKENWDNGYLDFSDSQLHQIALELSHIVPAYKEHLIDILKYDSDSKKRSTAANLLNWIGKDYEDTVSRIYLFLDDPALEVRNNLSRFIIYVIKSIQSASLRQKLINSLLCQLFYPSHADRNKALYCLLFIAQEFKEDRLYIAQKKELICSLAHTSILPNIQDPAYKLLQLIELK